MENTYEQAEQRVSKSAALSEHKDFILAAWPEGEERWEWVATASEAEILDWAETCQLLRTLLIADTAHARGTTRAEARANARAAINRTNAHA